MGDLQAATHQPTHTYVLVWQIAGRSSSNNQSTALLVAADELRGGAQCMHGLAAVAGCQLLQLYILSFPNSLTCRSLPHHRPGPLARS